MWMIPTDRRYSYEQADASVDKTKSQVQKVLQSLTNSTFRKAVFGGTDDWLDVIAPESKNAALKLIQAYSNTTTRYVQAQAIIEDTWKLYFMVRKYPWHGTKITKPDHLHFVWLSFTHHCYLFEERMKKFYSDWSILREQVGESPVDGGDHITRISKRLNEYIKHRGIHTHQWNITHNSYRPYEIVSFLHENTDDEYGEQERYFYFESKQEIKAHIQSGVGVMADEFQNLSGAPHEQLGSLSIRIGETLFPQSV